MGTDNRDSFLYVFVLVCEPHGGRFVRVVSILHLRYLNDGVSGFYGDSHPVGLRFVGKVDGVKEAAGGGYDYQAPKEAALYYLFILSHIWKELAFK